MACGRCGLRWDIADPEPPACPSVERRRQPRTLPPKVEEAPHFDARAFVLQRRGMAYDTVTRADMERIAVDAFKEGMRAAGK